ncbi:MAG: CapA family protein [Actinomycetota bacterium]|nr:CapA family protein [Actinomycetota bacterium]
MHAPGQMTTVATVSLVVLALAACSGNATGPGQATPSATTPHTPSGDRVGQGTPTDSPGSTTPSTASVQSHRAVTIAFAGDVHFEAFLARRLDHPKTAIGPLARVLAGADVSIVNLETAVTTRGTPEVKEYTFRAPPAAFTALKDAGIDVATMANNHAMDYGPVSVPDALAAAKANAMPVIGIGEDAAHAYRPWIVSVHGQRIAFLAATAFLQPVSLVPSWSAGPLHPGLAMAMPGHDDALVAAVKAVRPRVDTVVVDVHYGHNLQTCPTPWQRTLASDLAQAGADIVVGQHAHVLLGGGYLGSTYVDYGMGDFEFYVPNGGVTAETGVLVLTVDGRRVGDPRWVPAEIVDGLPTALSGGSATAAQQRWSALRGCTGLTAEPIG